MAENKLKANASAHTPTDEKTSKQALAQDWPQPRTIGRVNWIGLKTLFFREVRRFVAVYLQTVIAPVVTMLLFLAIFTLALGRGALSVEGYSYSEFLLPGLVMMAMLQNAFANTSSSLFIAKIQKNIVDFLMPPLSALELTLGFAGGGVVRGLMVGTVAVIILGLFVPVHMHSIGLVVFYGFNAALMLALIGTMAGVWAEKFDHIAAITNFVIVPLSFLSGTFYSISDLPEIGKTLAHINPFFYLIDGFRYGFLGLNDSSIILGMTVVAGINVILMLATFAMFHSGYKLKP